MTRTALLFNLRRAAIADFFSGQRARLARTWMARRLARMEPTVEWTSTRAGARQRNGEGLGGLSRSCELRRMKLGASHVDLLFAAITARMEYDRARRTRARMADWRRAGMRASGGTISPALFATGVGNGQPGVSGSLVVVRIFDITAEAAIFCRNGVLAFVRNLTARTPPGTVHFPRDRCAALGGLHPLFRVMARLCSPFGDAPEVKDAETCRAGVDRLTFADRGEANRAVVGLFRKLF